MTPTNFFLAGLALILVTLKLVGTIDISWFWAIAPVTFPAALVLIIYIVGLIAVSRKSKF